MKQGTRVLAFLTFVEVLAALTSSVQAEITGHILRHSPRPGFPDPVMPPESPSSLNYAAFAAIIALAGAAAVWVYRIEARRPHAQEASSP
jgi:hypothetical protein